MKEKRFKEIVSEGIADLFYIWWQELKAVDVENEIRLLGASKISLRLAEGKDGPVFTENGNFILDIHLSNIVPDLEQKLKAITGVIESGLFIGYDITVLMANR